MRAHSGVGIVGVGQTEYRRWESLSTPELAHVAVERALEHAGIAHSDVDAVFIGSAPDALLGVGAPDQWLAGAVGARGKPYMRISTGGSTGSSTAIAAYECVAAGLADVAIAVAVERANESNAVQMLMNTNFDPIYEKDFGINAISTYALAAVDHMIRHGTREEHLAIISARNHVNAINNPLAHLKLDITVADVLASRMLCWPIKLLDTCPRSDGACALVIASRAYKERTQTNAAWIVASKSYTDGYFLGDRPVLSHREHLARAARDVYAAAGITDPTKELDVAELQNPFTSSELMAIEALGFCEVGEGGPAVEAGLGEMDSELPINPSGGALSSNPIGATSLVRIAEVALQVTGEAGARQVDGARIGLAQCSGGSIQFGTVVILEGTAKEGVAP